MYAMKILAGGAASRAVRSPMTLQSAFESATCFAPGGPRLHLNFHRALLLEAFASTGLCLSDTKRAPRGHQTIY